MFVFFFIFSPGPLLLNNLVDWTDLRWRVLTSPETLTLSGTSLASPSGSGEESVCSAGDLGSIPGWESPLEKEMATHSNILAGKIRWTEEPVGL